MLKPSQMAIICLSFAKYAVEPFVSECEPPHSLVKLVAVISIGELLTIVNLNHLDVQFIPVSMSMTINNLLSLFQ